MTFSDFIKERVGSPWVRSARITERLRRVYGDNVKVITPARYAELEKEFERETGCDPHGYEGEPCVAHRAAANEMLAALKETCSELQGLSEHLSSRALAILDSALATIDKATGEPPL